MALDFISLSMIAHLIKGARIASFGYPDLLVSVPDVERLLHIKATEFTDGGSAHKFAGGQIVETRHALMSAGARSFECYDVVAHQGEETIIDLNEPATAPHPCELVINPGTFEHCFNVGQAFKTGWECTNLLGAILHICPMSMMNHGFYNICPTAIADFHEENGGKVIAMKAFDRAGTEQRIQTYGRFNSGAQSVLYALVLKERQVPVIKWPVQNRYKGTL